MNPKKAIRHFIDRLMWTGLERSLKALRANLIAAGLVKEIKYPDFISGKDKVIIQRLWPVFLTYLKSDKCPEEVGINKLQRAFGLGYMITAKTVETLEFNGYLGPPDQNTKLRKVLCKPIPKKMFCFNEDGVAEWIVAESIEQAIKFYEEITGGAMTQTFKEECADPNYSAETWEDFVASYVKEESPDKEFTMHWDNKRAETKTIREFLSGVNEVPCYFACQEY